MGAAVTLVKRSLQSFGMDRCATLSAAIAYRTVFSLFPMALVGVSILGFFLDDATAREQVIDGISKVISLGPDGETALAGTLEGINRAKGWFGLVGLVLAAWSASGLFGEIRSALNSVWDVDRPRPMLRAKAQDLLLMFGFGGLLVASTASTSVLQGARQAGAQWIGPLLDLAEPLFALLVFVAPLILTFAAFLFLYRFAPHARLRWRDVLPAALIAALFFEFGKNLLTYYIRNLSNFNALAGSLGAAILFLVFVYYASQVILFAAEIAKHRMLVVAGTLPATDPKLPRPKVPLTKKVKGSLVRLWSVGEVHHDPELPYQPARMDPTTNRPTNTREAVLLKQQQALKDAADDAGVSTRTTGARAVTAPPAAPPAFAAGAGVVEGRVERHNGVLSIRSGGHTHALTLTQDARVTRDGEPGRPEDIQPGDWVSAATDDKGSARRVEVRRQNDRADGNEAVRQAWQAAGFVATMLLSGVLKRGRHDGRDAGDESSQRRAHHNPRRRG